MIVEQRERPTRRAVVALVLAVVVLGSQAPALAGKIPTRPDVLAVIQKHLKLVEPKLDAAQKSKILAFANAFPSAGACPGYRFASGGGHVETTDRNGALLQAGFEAVFKGKFEAAEWCFLLAAQSSPDCSVFMSNAAFTLNVFGQYEDALILLNYVIARDPLFASAWVNIGHASKKTKDFDAAKSAYQMAIVLNPEIDDYQSELRGVYEASGDKKQAEQAKLDEALGVLDEAGAGGQGQASGGKKVPPPRASGVLDPSRMQFDPMVIELSSQLGQSYGSDMAVLEQLAPSLSLAAGSFLREAQWHAEQTGKTQGITSDLHAIGYAAWSGMAMICRGYLEQVTGSPEMADYWTQKGFDAVGHRPKNYNPIRGMSPEIKLPPIAVGFDGLVFKFNPGEEEIEFEFGEGIILGVSANKEGWGVKVGVGIMAEGAVIGGEAAYFIKWDSVKGFGGEVKLAGNCAGVQAELPVYEHGFGFENTDTPRAPPFRPWLRPGGK